MILDALICTNHDKFNEINSRIGHIDTTLLYVKLSYLARTAPAKIQKVDICNQIGISNSSFDRYTLRLVVQGLMDKNSIYSGRAKNTMISLSTGYPKLTVNFKKLKKIEEIADSQDAAILLSHIAYDIKYRHVYNHSIAEIGQIFCWGKSKVIYLLKRLEIKNLIKITYKNKIIRDVEINAEQIKDKLSVDNFCESVDKSPKSVDKSVDKCQTPKSYPQLKRQNQTTKTSKSDKLDPLFLILRNIKRNIIINTEEVNGSERSISYERTLRMFFVNEEFLLASLEHLKQAKEVGWETAEWLAQIRFSVLKTIHKNPERNVLNIICSCIKIACEKKWHVPSGFYESEEGRPYHAHIERQMLEHEERKWGGTASNNPVLEMLHQKLPKMASMRPP